MFNFLYHAQEVRIHFWGSIGGGPGKIHSLLEFKPIKDLQENVSGPGKIRAKNAARIGSISRVHDAEGSTS
jgi:hypothetical protein